MNPLEFFAGIVLISGAMKSNAPTDIATAGVKPVVVPSSPYNFVGLVQSGPVRLMSLVGPRTVVGAAHYQKENPLPSGCGIRFWPDVNTVITAVLSSIAVIDDLEFFSLDRDVSVAPVPLADPSQIVKTATFQAVGIQNVFADATPIVAPAAFQMISGNFAKFGQTAGATIENGDSGAPDLLLASGRLFIVGPHYSNRGPNAYWLTSIVAKYPDALKLLGL